MNGSFASPFHLTETTAVYDPADSSLISPSEGGIASPPNVRTGTRGGGDGRVTHGSSRSGILIPDSDLELSSPKAQRQREGEGSVQAVVGSGVGGKGTVAGASSRGGGIGGNEIGSRASSRHLSSSRDLMRKFEDFVGNMQPVDIENGPGAISSKKELEEEREELLKAMDIKETVMIRILRREETNTKKFKSMIETAHRRFISEQKLCMKRQEEAFELAQHILFLERRGKTEALRLSKEDPEFRKDGTPRPPEEKQLMVAIQELLQDNKVLTSQGDLYRDRVTELKKDVDTLQAGMIDALAKLFAASNTNVSYFLDIRKKLTNFFQGARKDITYLKASIQGINSMMVVQSQSTAAKIRREFKKEEERIRSVCGREMKPDDKHRILELEKMCSKIYSFLNSHLGLFFGARKVASLLRELRGIAAPQRAEEMQNQVNLRPANYEIVMRIFTSLYEVLYYVLGPGRLQEAGVDYPESDPPDDEDGTIGMLMKDPSGDPVFDVVDHLKHQLDEYIKENEDLKKTMDERIAASVAESTETLENTVRSQKQQIETLKTQLFEIQVIAEQNSKRQFNIIRVAAQQKDGSAAAASGGGVEDGGDENATPGFNRKLPKAQQIIEGKKKVVELLHDEEIDREALYADYESEFNYIHNLQLTHLNRLLQRTIMLDEYRGSTGAALDVKAVEKAMADLLKYKEKCEIFEANMKEFLEGNAKVREFNAESASAFGNTPMSPALLPPASPNTPGSAALLGPTGFLSGSTDQPLSARETGSPGVPQVGGGKKKPGGKKGGKSPTTITQKSFALTEDVQQKLGRMVTEHFGKDHVYEFISAEEQALQEAMAARGSSCVSPRRVSQPVSARSSRRGSTFGGEPGELTIPTGAGGKKGKGKAGGGKEKEKDTGKTARQWEGEIRKIKQELAESQREVKKWEVKGTLLVNQSEKMREQLEKLGANKKVGSSSRDCDIQTDPVAFATATAVTAEKATNTAGGGGAGKKTSAVKACQTAKDPVIVELTDQIADLKVINSTMSEDLTYLKEKFLKEKQDLHSSLDATKDELKEMSSKKIMYATVQSQTDPAEGFQTLSGGMGGRRRSTRGFSLSAGGGGEGGASNNNSSAKEEALKELIEQMKEDHGEETKLLEQTIFELQKDLTEALRRIDNYKEEVEFYSIRPMRPTVHQLIQCTLLVDPPPPPPPEPEPPQRKISFSEPAEDEDAGTITRQASLKRKASRKLSKKDLKSLMEEPTVEKEEAEAQTEGTFYQQDLLSQQMIDEVMQGEEIDAVKSELQRVCTDRRSLEFENQGLRYRIEELFRQMRLLSAGAATSIPEEVLRDPIPPPAVLHDSAEVQTEEIFKEKEEEKEVEENETQTDWDPDAEHNQLLHRLSTMTELLNSPKHNQKPFMISRPVQTEDDHPVVFEMWTDTNDLVDNQDEEIQYSERSVTPLSPSSPSLQGEEDNEKKKSPSSEVSAGTKKTPSSSRASSAKGLHECCDAEVQTEVPYPDDSTTARATPCVSSSRSPSAASGAGTPSLTPALNREDSIPPRCRRDTVDVCDNTVQTDPVVFMDEVGGDLEEGEEEGEATLAEAGERTSSSLISGTTPLSPVGEIGENVALLESQIVEGSAPEVPVYSTAVYVASTEARNVSLIDVAVQVGQSMVATTQLVDGGTSVTPAPSPKQTAVTPRQQPFALTPGARDLTMAGHATPQTKQLSSPLSPGLGGGGATPPASLAAERNKLLKLLLAERETSAKVNQEKNELQEMITQLQAKLAEAEAKSNLLQAGSPIAGGGGIRPSPLYAALAGTPVIHALPSDATSLLDQQDKKKEETTAGGQVLLKTPSASIIDITAATSFREQQQQGAHQELLHPIVVSNNTDEGDDVTNAPPQATAAATTPPQLISSLSASPKDQSLPSEVQRASGSGAAGTSPSPSSKKLQPPPVALVDPIQEALYILGALEKPQLHVVFEKLSGFFQVSKESVGTSPAPPGVPQRATPLLSQGGSNLSVKSQPQQQQQPRSATVGSSVASSIKDGNLTPPMGSFAGPPGAETAPQPLNSFHSVPQPTSTTQQREEVALPPHEKETPFVFVRESRDQGVEVISVGIQVSIIGGAPSMMTTGDFSAFSASRKPKVGAEIPTSTAKKDEEIVALREEADGLSWDNFKLKEELNALREVIEVKEKSLVEARDDAHLAESKLRIVEQNSEETQTELVQQIRDLEKQLEVLRDANNVKNQARGAYKQQYETLQAQSQKKDEKIKALEAELEESEEEIDKLKKEIRDTKNSMHSDSTDIMQLKDQIFTMRAKMRGYEKELSELKIASADPMYLREKIKATENRLEETEQKCREKDEGIAALQSNIESLNKEMQEQATAYELRSTESIGAFEQEISQHQTTIEGLEKSLEITKGDLNRANKALDGALAMNQETEAQLKQQQASYHQLSTEHSILRTTTDRKIAEQDSDILHLEDELEEVRREMSKASERFQHTMEELEKQNMGLEKLLEQKQQELVSAELKAEGLPTPGHVLCIADRMQKELDETRKELLQVKVELSVAEKTIKQSRGVALANKNLSSQQQLVELEQEVMKLKFELQYRNRELSTLHEASKVATEGLIEKISELNRTVDGLKVKLQRSEGDIASIDQFFISKFGNLSRADLIMALGTQPMTVPQQKNLPSSSSPSTSAGEKKKSASTPSEEGKVVAFSSPSEEDEEATSSTKRRKKSEAVGESTESQQRLVQELQEHMAAMQHQMLELMSRATAAESEVIRLQAEKQSSNIEEVLCAVKEKATGEYGAEKKQLEEIYAKLEALHSDERILDESTLGSDMEKEAARWLNMVFGKTIEQPGKQSETSNNRKWISASAATRTSTGTSPPPTALEGATPAANDLESLLVPQREYAKKTAFQGVPHFDQLHNFNFDIAAASANYTHRKGGLLVPLTMACVMSLRSLVELQLDIPRLEAFLHAVALLCDDERPFSNGIEAAMNVHAFHISLLNSPQRALFTPCELFAGYITVACSKILSYGAPLAFLASLDSPLFRVFPGEKSQQVVQLGVVQSLLSQPSYNFLKGSDTTQVAEFRRVLRTVFLEGLVPAQHRSCLANARRAILQLSKSTAQEAAATVSSDGGETDKDKKDSADNKEGGGDKLDEDAKTSHHRSDTESAINILSCIVRLINTAFHVRPRQAFMKSAERFVQELWISGDYARSNGQPILNSVHDRQRFLVARHAVSLYSSTVVRPAADALKPILPPYLFDRVISHVKYWLREDKATDAWFSKISLLGTSAWKDVLLKTVLQQLVVSPGVSRQVQTVEKWPGDGSTSGGAPNYRQLIQAMGRERTPSPVRQNTKSAAATTPPPLLQRTALSATKDMELQEQARLRVVLEERERLVGNLASHCTTLQRKVEGLSHQIHLKEGVLGESSFAQHVATKRAIWVNASPSPRLPPSPSHQGGPVQLEPIQSVSPLPPWAGEKKPNNDAGLVGARREEEAPTFAPKINPPPNRKVFAGPKPSTLPAGSRLAQNVGRERKENRWSSSKFSDL